MIKNPSSPRLKMPFLGGRLSGSRRRAALVIGDAGYRLIRMEGRRISGTEEWPRGIGARSAIIERLRELDDHRVMVLVDSIEQTYRREELPSASFLDRRRIIERRLEIAFPAAALRRAVHIGTENSGGRVQQSYLFAALPDSEELLKWCKSLERLDRPIDGIGLLPLEVASHAFRLRRFLPTFPTTSPAASHGSASARVGARSGRDASASWVLLVGREQTGGIRQIVLHNNTLALTRLAATPPADLLAEDLAIQIQRDLQSTLGYLARLGYQRGTPLTVLVIADEELRHAMGALPPLDPGISLVIRTPDEGLALLGFETADSGAPGLAAGSPWADPVFVALIAEDGLSEPLVTPAMMRRQRVWQATPNRAGGDGCGSSGPCADRRPCRSAQARGGCARRPAGSGTTLHLCKPRAAARRARGSGGGSRLLAPGHPRA